jgi:hypothetical protein
MTRIPAKQAAGSTFEHASGSFAGGRSGAIVLLARCSLLCGAIFRMSRRFLAFFQIKPRLADGMARGRR